ncbi:hypothetical protein D7Z26_03950 [Cohnella endophytica]|uniref:PpiC domain-containing protein n=1 Tax=Cohnella endophytica TaxID=2419778 RepID=A0A494Y375_9BACL|nr:peptidylprolyl isomerase [Cohnella endophytica]RKP57144.1 hypothetical protein D7Z26_03950 [Cohnella endophytica]
MTERNENELNDKTKLTNAEEENELELNETEGVDSEIGAQDLADEELEATSAETAAAIAAPVVPVASAAPTASTKNPAAVAVPWIIAVIAIAAFLFVLLKNPSDDLNKTVAKMDGISVKNSDVLNAISKQMGEDQFSSYVDRTAEQILVDSQLDKAGIKVKDEDIQKAIDSIKLSNNIASDEDLTAALQQSGMTLEGFKEQLKPEVELKLLFDNQNKASEDDLKAYFEKYKDSKFATTPKEIKASHILLQTKEEAEAVLAELKAGKDFATLAKEKSQDTGSKDNGGDLGFFGKGVMNSGFETAAFALAKGEMSGVVEAESGFHIIKVTDVKEAVIPAYDDVKEKVKDAYYQEKYSTDGQAWLEKLKKDNNYKNLLVKAAEPAASASQEASPSASPAAK